MALLKACPFCAEDMEELNYDHENRIYYVRCTWCGARGPIGVIEFVGREAASDEAIDGWNDRVKE